MSASELLKRALEYELCGRKMESLKLYTDGIAQLMIIYQGETDAERKSRFQTRLIEYLDRAEKLKQYLKQLSSKGEIKDRFRILDGARGYGYDTVIGKHLDDSIVEITIEDPYIREHHQLCQLVMVCELAVLKCRNLKFIKVTTQKDTRPNAEQVRAFDSLQTSLRTDRNIIFDVEYSDTMHDREIILSNGHVIKIGRGLDYFKPPANKFTLGSFDFNLRACRETNVEVSFYPDMKK